MSSDSKRPHLTIRLSQEQLDALTELADSRGKARAALAEELVVEGLAHATGQPFEVDHNAKDVRRQAVELKKHLGERLHTAVEEWLKRKKG